MKVFLTTGVDADWSRSLLAKFREVALCDRLNVHELADGPTDADVLLFVDAHQYPSDWSMRILREHELVRRFPRKSFVYDERDFPGDALPGVYVGMPRRRFDRRRHRAFAYYRLITDTSLARGREPDLLFSFHGRRLGRLRSRVLAVSDPRGLVEDTSNLDFFGQSCGSLEEARRRYVDVVGRSKFVLCPRGAGTASVRLFEALAAGRVPVVMSDDWVPPAGIDWDACSVRLPESKTAQVADRLEALEEDWPTLAEAAAATYDDWFAPDVWFHRVADLCGELLADGKLGVARRWTRAHTWRAAARHARERIGERFV